jgi:hypothetical protein
MNTVHLPEVAFRIDESRGISHRLEINGVAPDLTAWSIELYVNGALTRTITTASNLSTVGRIALQTTNAGEYTFTLLAADIVTLLGESTRKALPAYIRYVTPDVSPPRIFSGVSFFLVVYR